MSIAPPTPRMIGIIDRILAVLAWGCQIGAAVLYLGVTFTSDTWRKTLAHDPAFSINVRRRIRTLALRAENVALLQNGDRRIERQLHQQFADLRIGNTEWFAYETPLTDYVTEQNRLARKEEAK
jgi:hypothetical protein